MVVFITFWWMAISKCTGTPVTVTWTKNQEPDIKGYHVHVNGSLVLTSEKTGVVVEANPGDSITVSAFNEFLEGPQSSPWIVPKTLNMVKVRLWRSTNLIDKTLVAEFYFEKKDREFFNLTIETP